MDMWNVLERKGIEIHNKYVAIESATKMKMSPNDYRNTIRDMLDLKDADVSDIGDAEACSTLSYLIVQAFDPMTDMNLDEAWINALAHLEKYPYSQAKSDPNLDKDGNLIANGKWT